MPVIATSTLIPLGQITASYDRQIRRLWVQLTDITTEEARTLLLHVISELQAEKRQLEVGASR